MEIAKTILIADDDDEIIAALSMRCRQMGLRVVIARTAFDALMEIRNQVPDVACLDVNMPAGDGLSVCEMLAGDQDSWHLPVIILTGRKDDRTIRRCHDLTAHYVAKGTDVWTRIEPLLRQILRLPTFADANADDSESSGSETSRPNAAPSNSSESSSASSSCVAAIASPVTASARRQAETSQPESD